MDPLFDERGSQKDGDAAGPVGSGDALPHDRPVYWALTALERAAVVFCRIRLRPDVRVEEISHGVERLTGHPADEFATDPDLVRRVVHPDDRRKLDATLADPAQIVAHSGLRLVRRDGRVVHTEHVAFVTRDGRGAPASIDLLVRDVSALRGTAEEHGAAGEANGLSVVAYLAEAAGFTHLSPAIENVTGFTAEEWTRQPTLWVERLHPDDRARMLFLWTGGAAGQPWQAEYRWLSRDGRIIWIRQASAPIRTARGQPICQQGLLLPGAPARSADPNRVEAQRMEAMARLAGAVAHDLNNVLTVVLGHAEMLSDTLRETGPARESALEIKNATETAARITAQLLAVSGRQVLTSRLVDLNEVIHEAADSLHELAGGDLDLRFDLAPSLPRVEIDVRQLQRVLRNLVADARDANGVRATIATRAGRQDERWEVVLTVTDTRPRLPEDAIASIFEPAVGSRRTPRGASLNRAAVYGIITQIGGRISVDQAPGGGLTFTVGLPSKTV